jgi:hypothetical protein
VVNYTPLHPGISIHHYGFGAASLTIVLQFTGGTTDDSLLLHRKQLSITNG